MKFAILVTSSPYGEQGSSSAYQFAEAVIAEGHQLIGVFFYQQGTLNGNSLLTPAADEVNLVQAWAQLAQAHGFGLDVCVSAALRRGVVDSAEAERAQLSQYNLAAPFALTGLGQLAELSAACDRLVQF